MKGICKIFFVKKWCLFNSDEERERFNFSIHSDYTTEKKIKIVVGVWVQETKEEKLDKYSVSSSFHVKHWENEQKRPWTVQNNAWKIKRSIEYVLTWLQG